MRFPDRSLLTASVATVAASTAYSNDFSTEAAIGATFVANLSASTATTGVVLKLQGKDVNGNYYDIPGAVNSTGFGASTTGIWSITLGPNVSDVTGTSTVGALSTMLPNTMRLAMTQTGTGGATVSSLTMSPWN